MINDIVFLRELEEQHKNNIDKYINEQDFEEAEYSRRELGFVRHLIKKIDNTPQKG